MGHRPPAINYYPIILSFGVRDEHNHSIMKYEIGDKIILLHSKEEGTVVDIINADMVMVEVGRISFPVYLDQIDFPYFYRFSEKKAPPPPQRVAGEDIRPEKKTGTLRMDRGVFLSVLPVYQQDGYEEQVQLLKFHLLNETQYTFRFSFQLWIRHQLELELRNEVLPFGNFYLSDMLFESLNDNPRLEFIFYAPGKDPKLAPSFAKTWKIKPRQFFTQLHELRARRDATLSYLLFEKYPLRQEAPPAPDTAFTGLAGALQGKIQVQPDTPLLPKYELDLHIEQLEKDWKGLSNIAILAIQLNEFRRYLDLAIAHHQPSMIVIHGVGKGKLREEIHAILKQTPEVERFVNEYHPRYGYGATEIFFR